MERRERTSLTGGSDPLPEGSALAVQVPRSTQPHPRTLGLSPICALTSPPSQIHLDTNADAADAVKQKAGGELADLHTLQGAASRAAREHAVLCVLDDVWDPAHARVIGESLDNCTLIVTTRIHHLLPRAHHVHCGLLSQTDSLLLLLRAGGILGSGAQTLPTRLPKAALQAIELCGRLPLLLALAGAMIQEHADHWEHRLVPLLRGNNKAELRRRSLNEEDEEDGDDSDGNDGMAAAEADGVETVERRVIGSSRARRPATAASLHLPFDCWSSLLLAGRRVHSAAPPASLLAAHAAAMT